MERKTSRNLYLIGLVLGIVGFILFAAAGGVAFATANPDTGTLSNTGAASSSILALIAILLLVVGGILSFIAWVGALIKTARLSQWVWFIILLVLSFSAIPMLIYIFAGPTEAKAAA